MSNITRVCSHLWRIGKYWRVPQKQGGKLRSMKFACADDDLHWCLEHKLEIKSVDDITVSFNLLRPDCYDDLRKCESVSGNVDIILMNGWYRPLTPLQDLSKKQSPFTFSFGEQTRICNVAEFSMSSIQKNFHPGGPTDLLTLCNITYCKKNETVTIPSLNNSNIVRDSESRLSSDMERCFIDDQSKDVTISVQDKQYRAHKTILAARSTVFDKMLRVDRLVSKKNHIDINYMDHSIDPEPFEEMLYYIYTGKVKNLDESAFELLPLADLHNLEELKSMCEEVLVKKLTTDNAAKILILADTHHAGELKTHTLRFIKENYESCKDFNDIEFWLKLAAGTRKAQLLKEMMAAAFCERQKLD